MSPETEPKPTQDETEETGPAWSTREWLKAIVFSLLGFGLLANIIYGWQFYPASAAFLVICTGVTTAGACLLTGALLGLLFGIPRSEAESRPAGQQEGESEPRYRANTNLEQISDWLTKILVGVGLTQLPTIRTEMRSLVVFVGRSLGAQPTSAGFAFGAREKLTGFARQNLPTDLASSRELMQGSDFRFRSCCPRANRNGYAHLDEDNGFAARQKSGADDIAVSTPYAAHTPKTARNAVLRVGNSIRVQMGNFWRAPRGSHLC